jgi:hypothetical protein
MLDHVLHSKLWGHVDKPVASHLVLRVSIRGNAVAVGGACTTVASLATFKAVAPTTSLVERAGLINRTEVCDPFIHVDRCATVAPVIVANIHRGVV